jgi:hypothetical protein
LNRKNRQAIAGFFMAGARPLLTINLGPRCNAMYPRNQHNDFRTNPADKKTAPSRGRFQ